MFNVNSHDYYRDIFLICTIALNYASLGDRWVVWFLSKGCAGWPGGLGQIHPCTSKRVQRRWPTEEPLPVSVPSWLPTLTYPFTKVAGVPEPILLVFFKSFKCDKTTFVSQLHILAISVKTAQQRKCKHGIQMKCRFKHSFINHVNVLLSTQH